MVLAMSREGWGLINFGIQILEFWRQDLDANKNGAGVDVGVGVGVGVGVDVTRRCDGFPCTADPDQTRDPISFIYSLASYNSLSYGCCAKSKIQSE